MTSLVRTKSAGFDIENAVTLSKLEEDGYEKYLINTDFVFKSLPTFNADFDTKKRLVNGAKTTVSAPVGRYRAVSYTHLDVYKRQISRQNG